MIHQAHLPCVEGVSGALTQQCVGASVFLASPKRISLLLKFPYVVRAQTVSRFQQVVANAFGGLPFAQHHSIVMGLCPNNYVGFSATLVFPPRKD